MKRFANVILLIGAIVSLVGLIGSTSVSYHIHRWLVSSDAGDVGTAGGPYPELFFLVFAFPAGLILLALGALSRTGSI